VTTDDIKKYFRKTRDYEKAYTDGKIGAVVEKAVKIYKSHRRVTSDLSATSPSHLWGTRLPTST
jgi:hypothetical protein